MQSLYSTSALAVIAAVFSQPAWASVAQQSQQPSAEAASDSDVRSDEIIVTAQRRDQNIQDVPIAINALSSNHLKDRQIESVADLAASLPGVKFAEFSGAGNVYIRGVGTTLVSGSGESSIAAHVDGIYLAQAQATTMVQDDLGRVEVLRGPQGTLYGRNSTGGVINYISADPSNEFSGSVSALYGNYDRKQIQGNINAPLSDNVRVRLYGKYQDRDGWTLNTITGQKLDGIKQAAGRVSVDANVTPTWTSKLRLTVDHEDITGPVFDAYVPGRVFPGVGFDLDPRKVSSPDIYDSYKEVWVGSFKNEFQLGDVKLTSLSGLVDFTFNADYDGVPGTRPVRINRIQKSRDYSQELNLSGSAGKLDFIAGVYYYQSNKSTVSLTDFSKFVIALPNSVITHSSKQHSYSGFGDMTYRVSETVRLYGGLRYSAEDLEQSLDIVGQCSGANIQKFKSNGITGRAGLQADVSDGVMVYGQYSHP